MHLQVIRTSLFAAAATLTLGVPSAAFAYDESDAIRDCNNRLRSEYKLSDFRSESATKIKDGSHHYQVTGKTKIDGEKYGYGCEIKDRHVTSVRYDGPEPEGLGTAETLAVGAAAAIATGLAVQAMTKDKDEAAEAAPAPKPEIRTLSGGQMEVLVPVGCSVLYNDLGLREKSTNCSSGQLSSASQAMSAHLRAQGASR